MTGQSEKSLLWGIFQLLERAVGRSVRIYRQESMMVALRRFWVLLDTLSAIPYPGPPKLERTLCAATMSCRVLRP